MNAIGPKLNAIFSLGMTSFVGCHHKSDYTLLRRQYPLFHLPTEGVIEKMSDVGVMDLNRGLVKKGRGTTTLQALCRAESML